MIVYTRHTPAKEVSNITRVKRCLMLIIFLSEWRTIKQIANHLDITERTVQRYFNLLVNLGFEIDVRHKIINSYRLRNLKGFFGIQ